MLNTPFPPWPSFTPEEADAVRDVLLSNRVNAWTGDETRRFEREFAQAVDAREALAVANGTLALDLALAALGVGPGDEVVVTPRSFIASVSCVANAGAVPVFADVDPDTQALSAVTVAPHLTERTRAVVLVHLGGVPADLAPLVELCAARGVALVEDCAQAHGARYRGRSVGTFGAVGAWSFCQDKIMSTGGEGGMVTSDDPELLERMWSIRDHGKSRAEVRRSDHPPGFRWLHHSFGTNFRLTEMQAAIGRVQLRRLPRWHARRLENARYLRETCAGIDWLRVPELAPDVEEAAYRFYAFVRPERLPRGWDRDRVVREIGANGVPVYQGTCSEIYLERAFEGTGWRPLERLPAARELGERSLMFLTHPTLEAEHMERVGAALTAVAERVEGARGPSAARG